MLFDRASEEKFINSIIFALRAKAQKLRVDPGSIVAVGLVACDKPTEEWLKASNEEGLIMAVMAAKEGWCIDPLYAKFIGKIPKTMLQAKKRIILRKKADGAAAYYRPMYKNADENSLFLEVYTYVHCGDAAKAEIIATSIEATLDDWLKT